MFSPAERFGINAKSWKTKPIRRRTRANFTSEQSPRFFPSKSASPHVGASSAPLAAWLAERLPSAQHMEVAGAGHQLHAHNAGVFNQLLGSFLARNSSDLEAQVHRPAR